MTAPVTRIPMTRPGSNAHRIATTVQAETARCGHGVTVEDARVACAATGFTSSCFTAEFFALVRRGVLVAVGGRASRTEYAHAATPTPARDAAAQAPTDDAIKVLEALTSVARRLGRWVTTREVTLELRRLGLRLAATQPNAVRTLLSTLARTRSRGHTQWSAARVLRGEVAAATGAPSVLWCPVALPLPKDHDVPRSESDALRRLVQVVEAELDGPVSRQDLRWWLDAHPTHPTATVLRAGALGRVLDFTLQADARCPASTLGRLSCVEGARSCHGGAPARYSTTDTPHGRAVAVLEDVLAGLRPHVEVEQIAALRRRAERHHADELASFAERRWEVLRGALGPYLESDAEPVLVLAQRRLAARERWANTASGSDDVRSSRRVALDEASSALAALARLGRDDGGVRHHATGPRPAIAGEQGLATFLDIDPFIEAAAGELGIAVRKRATLLRRARRFPNATAEPRTRWAAGERPVDLNVLDRVDALMAVYGAVHVPRPNALLQSAHALLGSVVRDVAEVRAVAEQARTTDEALWRAAVVALGLLGVSPTGLARPASGDSWNARAVILGTVLSDPKTAGEALMQQDPTTWFGAEDILDIAMMRLERGRLMTVVG